MRRNHPVRRVVLTSAATVSGIVLLVSLKPTTDPASGEGAARGQQVLAGSHTVLGDVVTTRYGDVQVRLTVTDGKISKSEAVKAPKGGLNDKKTAMSVPVLDKETVTAQSADIDSVSGATYTSNGYKKSLQSALDKAKTEGLLGQGGSGGSQGTRTFTGDVVRTKYGPVQVRITVTDGKITKADAVQTPKGGLNDKKTAMSVPVLDKETVTAQSASIDSVSGATYTSNGYKQSLQSALDQIHG